jgi:hypothetical protein
LNKIKSSFWLQFPVDEMKCLFIEKGKVLEWTSMILCLNEHEMNNRYLFNYWLKKTIRCKHYRDQLVNDQTFSSKRNLNKNHIFSNTWLNNSLKIIQILFTPSIHFSKKMNLKIRRLFQERIFNNNQN